LESVLKLLESEIRLQTEFLVRESGHQINALGTDYFVPESRSAVAM
jgi:hypothetical protein